MNETVKTITPSLEVNELCKSYGKHDVVKDVTFKLYPGQVFALLGHNGVGKSTLVDCIVGLKMFDSGEVKIMDHDILDEPIKAKMSFGYVPSEPIAYEMMTGKEYLSFMAGAYNMKQKDFATNMKVLSDRLHLSPFDLRRKISEYSHGMKQKVCLIASLIHDPALWIMDEPTVGLDPQVMDTLAEMIKELANNNRTIFIVSHDIDFVSKVATDISIMKDGVFKRNINKKNENMSKETLRLLFDALNKKEKEA